MCPLSHSDFLIVVKCLKFVFRGIYSTNMWPLKSEVLAAQNVNDTLFIYADIYATATATCSSMDTVNKNTSYCPVGPWVCICVFWLHVHVCFVLPLSVESLPFMFWHWHNKLKWAAFEFFAPSPLLQVRSWLHPFKGHCEQKAMRDEGVIYVAGHPLLNSRYTRLPGCIRLRNDLYCVEWGVKQCARFSIQKGSRRICPFGGKTAQACLWCSHLRRQRCYTWC